MLKRITEKIKTAHVYDIAIVSPINEMPILSETLNNKILIKREDMQKVRSFKCRGAYNKIAQLTQDQRDRGVIASSAGNHAQGVALAALNMGFKACIVMPQTTPPIKIQAVQRLKADIVLHGATYDEAFAHAQQLQQEKGYTFIHPYDDEEVIAGQGTVAMELLNQVDHIDALYVPVGGGGLLAGVLCYIKTINPRIKIIGVEPEDAACLKAALEAQTRVTLPQVGIFADGVAVKLIGDLPFKLVKDHIDAIITVSTDEICAAIKDLYDNCRAIAEPAGAVGLAGLKKHAQENGLHNQTLCTILSGANMNFDRLRHIAERADIGLQKEVLFSVKIPEKPGSFKTFCEAIGKRSVTEFNYRYSDPDNAYIFVGVDMQNAKVEKEPFFKNLQEKGYDPLDLSQNELAILHIRHMVGGKSPRVENEKLFRVEFPEKPGALMQFLGILGSEWNISLFHYRNHGADYGRVLVGIQLPQEAEHLFAEKMNNIGYTFVNEANNPVFTQFL